MGAFRWQGKHVFLTYPHCDASKDELLHYWTTHEWTLSFGVVSREAHADGTWHLHALLGFDAKHHTRNSRAFDLHHAGRVYHPNIAPARTIADIGRIATYVRKHGDYVDYGSIPTKSSRWGDVLRSDNRDEFLRMVQEVAPRDYVLSYDRIVAFADNHYAPPRVEVTSRSISDFNEPVVLKNWREQVSYAFNMVSGHFVPPTLRSAPLSPYGGPSPTIRQRCCCLADGTASLRSRTRVHSQLC